MPPNTIKRQPISCENCRNRKIKCTGGRAPCDSCIRRGFQSTCHFLRCSSTPHQGTSYSDLIERISYLENSLKEHIDHNPSCQRSTRLLTPADISSTASTSPEVAISLSGQVESAVSNFPLTGFLLKSPGGYIRFVPHTEAFNSEDMAAFMHTESPDSNSSVADFPFSSDSLSSRQTLLELLPSKRQCDELIKRYLNVFSPLFHILHDPTLHAKYTEFGRTPHQAPLAFLAMLFVILAIAIHTLEEDDPLLEELSREGSGIAKIRRIATRYRQAAMKCLSTDQFMLQHNLYSVKALVLLIYAMSHTDGPTWPLLGLTLHIATAIGCHIDPRLLDVGPVEAEERRRCWAGLKMLYQNQATCMGNLLPNPVSAEVDLPADVNDDEITDNGLISPASTSYAWRPPTQMTYILYKFRLYKVATEVCHATLSFLPLQSPLLRSLDARIAQEEDELVRRFSNRADLPLHHLAHMHILKNYTNQLYLILHRPYLKGSFSTFTTSADVHMNSLSKSRARCKEAAVALLDSHQQLYETADFRNYYWYVYRLGSFNAFLGASTLLAILLDPQLLDVNDGEYCVLLAMVQACTQRLESMSERSEVCAKASPILRRLLRRTEQQAQQRMGRIENIPGSVGSGVSFSVPQSSDIGHPKNAPIADAVELNGWAMHPELNTIMTHLPPEQWLAPSAFSWDRCWNPEAVEPSTLMPGSW